MWQGIKNIYHLFNAFLANVWFGFPSRKLTVVGVTGTDGKTTTVSLIYHILHTAGYNASMISSVGAIIGGKDYDVGFHVTTPSPWALERFIKKTLDVGLDRNGAEVANKNFLVRNAKETTSSNPNKNPASANSENFIGSPRLSFLVLETTSHALDQHRVFGIKFAVGVLTNVTHEHLDYHKTYENYVNTKTKLLKRSKVAIVNKDDESYKIISNIKNKILKIHSKNKKWITYGMGRIADINPINFPFKTNLIGEFNVYNSLAAIAACKELGIRDQDIRGGIESFNAPIGREEIVYKKDFTAMIDFAHTPYAFEKILSTVRPMVKGRLIHVFGAAGQRDATKRPLMGKISAKYSDIIVLTVEDPRSESVEKIMEEIETGILNFQFSIFNEKNKIQNDKKYLFKIKDRQEAIGAAIKMARKGDFVLITGKSHEKSMNYGRGEELWDEFGAVKKALRLRLG